MQLVVVVISPHGSLG